MNRLKGVFHTIRFMWVGRFGGSIIGGEYYLLKPIKIHKDANAEFADLAIHTLHNKAAFVFDCSQMNVLKLDDVTLKNKGWVFSDE